MKFQYYYGTDVEQFNFFRIPKKLIREKQFVRLSSDAKILYGLLMDRMTLSVKNGWMDEEGRVYIIFTIEDIAEEFFCSTRKAINLINELGEIGLIERKRRGMGLPNLIYVKNFNSEPYINHQETGTDQDTKNKSGVTRVHTQFQEVQEYARQEVQEYARQEVQECARQEVQECVRQEVQECARQEVQECARQEVQECAYLKNDTDRNDTKYINNPSIYLSGNAKDEGWSNRKAILESLKERTGYDCLIHDHAADPEQLHQIIELLADVCCQSGEYVSFGGNKIPIQDMRERVMRLDIEHLRYVLQCMERNTGKIHNIRGYLLSCLYNAPVTIRSYYQAMVRHDMAKGG